MAGMGKNVGGFFLRVLQTGESKGEFRTRLGAEGRWDKFVKVREKLKSKDSLSGAQAWQAASGQFFPLGDGREDERDVDVILRLVRSELDAAKDKEPIAEVAT